MNAPEKCDAGTPVLRQANDNPWYCLATLYGEQVNDRWDEKLAKRNSDAWNLWINDRSEGVRADLVAAFIHRTGGSLILPHPTVPADLSHTYFDRYVSFSNFQFTQHASF